MGSLTELNYYFLQGGCDEDEHDSDYIHLYDYHNQFDSLQRLTSETYNFFDGDTNYLTQSVTEYEYDTAGNVVARRLFYTYPLPAYQQKLDSTAFDQDNHKIYSLTLLKGLSGLDTTGLEQWFYDSAGVLYSNIRNTYNGGNLSRIYTTTYFYDTLQNLVLEKEIISSPEDSMQTIYEYDSLNRRLNQWDQEVNPFSGLWVNEGRTSFEYDSLSRIKNTYFFNCSDSLCIDSANRIEYLYDASGHLVETRFYGMYYMGHEYTTYNTVDSVLTQGYYYIDPSGCDESYWKLFTYNSDYHLLHTHEVEAECSQDITECDYFELNEDSLFVHISYPNRSCQGDTVHFAVAVGGGTPPYQFSWSPSTNILDPGFESPRILTDTTVIYTLTVTDSLGLTASAADTLHADPLHFTPVTLSAVGIPCPGNPVFLSFSPDTFAIPYYYLEWWQNGNVLSVTNDTLSVYASGNYSVNLIDPWTGCNLISDPYSILFFPSPLPAVYATGDTVFCQGLGVTLVSDTFEVVLWNTGDSAYSILAEATGSYYVQVTDTNGCTGYSNHVQVTVHPLPLLDLGPDTMLCAGNSLLLDAGIGFDIYLWQDGSSAQSFVAFSPVADTQYISITVTDSNLCQNSDTMEIVFDFCSTVGQKEERTDIIVFPNPVSGNLRVKIPEFMQSENLQLAITDASGRLLWEKLMSQTVASIDLSFLTPGVYLFQVRDDSHLLNCVKLQIQ